MSQAPTTQAKTSKRNRLQFEKSPYLLQHADNPVDWYPWGPEAFETARKQNKPIFLSVGYSTCHWCHVMEHESFEDPEVARLMNDAFVSIKVDREERPDIDSVYMSVCQILTGSGGWPLTIIMTPDKKPFFAATYIPRENRFGRIGMVDLIPRIKELWASQQADLIQSANQITESLRQGLANGTGSDLDETSLRSASMQLARRFDDERGGFGDSPKFPTPHNLTFLLRQWKRSGNDAPLQMVERTLHEMRLGGIYDHIGFGFHRYSTDRCWLVPHFEKMLYDQALITIAYLEAFQATAKSEYAATAREILTYVLRDMTSPEGGFFSAEDADSEGVEGKFYVWTEKQIRDVLPKDEADLTVKVFNVHPAGNFDEESTGSRTGANIPHLTGSLPEIAFDMGIDESTLRSRLEAARRKLFEARADRVHPHKDDKILTDWNGLMIAALARAGQVLDEKRYTAAAARAADLILKTLRTSDGRLLHRYRQGQPALTATLDDYAFVIWGLIELYEATFDAAGLHQALRLNDELIAHFWDDERGGFFLTADDAEQLLVRQREIYDGATPSGNSVAMLNLLRLARITANPELERRAAAIGRSFSKTIGQFPGAHNQLMIAVDFAVGPTREVVIVGRPESEDTQAMLRALRHSYAPNKVVILRPADQESPEIADLAPYVKDYSTIGGKSAAYVCTNHRCDLPTTDVDEMLRLLERDK